MRYETFEGVDLYSCIFHLVTLNLPVADFLDLFPALFKFLNSDLLFSTLTKGSLDLTSI